MMKLVIVQPKNPSPLIDKKPSIYFFLKNLLLLYYCCAGGTL
jgi:hypothetical protein